MSEVNKVDEGLDITSSHIAAALDLVKSNPEFAKDPEVEKLLELAKNVSNGVQGGNAVQKSGDGGSEGKEGTGNKGANPQNGKEDKGEDSADDGSPFFSKKASEEIEVTLDKFPEIVKKNFGIDEDDDDKVVKKFYDEASKWKNDVVELSKTKNKFDELVGGLKKLPSEIVDAINRFEKGEDWSVQKSNVDYSKDFDSNDLYEVIETFFPGKFEKDDLSDKSDPQVSFAIDAAKAKFDAQKEKIKLINKNKIDEAKIFESRYKDSVKKTVSELKKEFPDFSESHIEKVKDLLEGNKVVNLFYDSNGMLKDDASIKIALAMFGKDELKKRVGKARNQGKSSANIEIINSGNKTPASGNASRDEGVIDNYDSIISGFTGNNVY